MFVSADIAINAPWKDGEMKRLRGPPSLVPPPSSKKNLNIKFQDAHILQSVTMIKTTRIFFCLMSQSKIFSNVEQRNLKSDALS